MAKNYQNPIYYISTNVNGHLATIRVYVQEFDPNANYSEIAYSTNHNLIIKIFNDIRDSLIKNLQKIDNEAWQKLKKYDPSKPIEK